MLCQYLHCYRDATARLTASTITPKTALCDLHLRELVTTRTITPRTALCDLHLRELVKYVQKFGLAVIEPIEPISK